MDWLRIWHSFRMIFILSGRKRAEYVKKKKIFGYIGDNCMLQIRKIPLYPNLIKLHNNVKIASNVRFITHDVIHSVFNSVIGTRAIKEKKGHIEISDNVFIGSDSIILYDVKIGPNVIIAAGSVVTKNIPENTIWGGNPARCIGKFDALMEKRRESYTGDTK